ncbi:MAG: helix-turn-helix domain-containing protein, partial [Acidobacteria bacterium]|nr:helix-turn-helix domain-containing protein [Acidobacteriota bacterium]
MAMSMKIFATPDNNFANRSVRRGKHSVMNAEHENLADYVRRIIKEKKLTYRQMQDRGGLSPSTLS